MMEQCALCDTKLGPVITESTCWQLILNKNQNLLGKCFLVLHRHLEAVPQLSPTEWADLHEQLARATRMLSLAFQPDHFNYAFLQNQDRHIHLHIIPRYNEPRVFAGITFDDPDYPAHYAVPAPSRYLAQDQFTTLAGRLRHFALQMENTMTEVKRIADFAPDDVEAGVGLALQDDAGRYLFFLAGTRHNCPPGELFYAGIGGHREEGEGWLACAQREAQEEIGTAIEILSAPVTWYVPQNGPVHRVEVVDRPRPLAFYEMIHPTNTPRAGQEYRIVVYKARPCDWCKDLSEEEVQGVIALTAAQVIRGPERRPTLAELVKEGAAVVAGGETVSPGVGLYPIGTAMALAHILRCEKS